MHCEWREHSHHFTHTHIHTNSVCSVAMLRSTPTQAFDTFDWQLNWSTDFFCHSHFGRNVPHPNKHSNLFYLSVFLVISAMAESVIVCPVRVMVKFFKTHISIGLRFNATQILLSSQRHNGNEKMYGAFVLICWSGSSRNYIKIINERGVNGSGEALSHWDEFGYKNELIFRREKKTPPSDKWNESWELILYFTFEGKKDRRWKNIRLV